MANTDITIILDRSGSMHSIRTDTIGGFNRFLSDQQAAPGEASITLNQFDHEFQRVLTAAPIQSALPLTHATFVPRGNTALLDAIGRSITETGKRLSAINEGQRPGKVAVVIITDGMENASREYTRERINQMISHQRDAYQWEFVFLAANQDAIAVGQSLGVKAANSMTYAANSAGTCAAFAATSDNLRAMRSGQSRSMAYSVKDRAEQRKAGAK